MREQARLDREAAQKAREREEEHQRLEAQRKQEAAEEARRFAEDQSGRKQEQLREQARLDREAAQKARELAEREEPKIAEVTNEAEEARRAAAAEQRLAEIRSRIEAADREKKEALSQSQEAEAKRRQELQREGGSRETLGRVEVAPSDFDKAVGSATYLTAYVMHCDGKLPPATRMVLNNIITEAGDAKMLVNFGKVDEERKQMGTEKFCALVRDVYADLL